MPKQTLESAYRAFFPIISAKCLRMLGDREEAQDVAQETFIRLWKADCLDGDPRKVTSWVYRTSTHLAIDQLRRRRARTQAALDPASGPGEATNLERRATDRQLLARVAAQVPREELEVALLSRLDGLTQPEIAQVTHRSDRTVRRLLVRFDQRLEGLKKESSP